VFSFLGTQWRYAGMAAVATGLDYGGVKSALEIYEVRDKRDCFERIQVMEYEALKVMAETRKAEIA
jgi:hypothetical protein